MGDLFARWRDKIEVNSQRAVEVYTREMVDFRAIATDERARATILDFAVFLRQRSIALVAEGRPFTGEDLGFIAAVGHDRAVNGISIVAQRQVLALHTSLTLREVKEAAGPHDLDDVMRVLSWFPPQGEAAQAAYTRGYLAGQESVLPAVDRVRLLATLLVADDPLAPGLAASLGMVVPEEFLVLVCRLPDDPTEIADRVKVLDQLLAEHWLPVCWEESGELIVLAPDEERAALVIREFAGGTGIPCAVGAARGPVGGLAAVLELAREVSRVAPIHCGPVGIHHLPDLFAEIGAARLAPVGDWLRELAGRLATGPELVGTLDAFYRNDMGRLRAAAALGVHPRTVDYRLRRVHELTGLDPLSVKGIRVLSTTVNRVLAGTP